MASTVSRTAMSFVDFLMVSRLGPEAQAAVLPAGLLLFVGLGFGLGLLSVVNSFVAQALGRGTLEECSAYAWQGVWISAVLAILALPLWFVVPPAFAWIGHDPAVRAMEVTYVRIGILGVFPMLASAAITNFFTGIHRPAIGFWAMLVGNVFNVAGNYALIYGNWGFPAMGIGGAAIATQLSAVVQTIILTAWMLRPTTVRTYGVLHTWRPDFARLMGLVRFGVPAALHWTLDIGAFTIFTVLIIGRFGTAQLAAHNIVMKIFELAFMPTLGIGIAVTAAVGKAIGERRPDYARDLTRWGARIGMAYMGSLALLLVAMRFEVSWLLAPKDTDPPFMSATVIAWASALLVVCSVYQVFDAIFIVHIHALRGAGDNNVPAVLSAMCAATLLIGGGYAAAWLVPQWGVLGPWTAGVVYVMAMGTCMWARWRFGPWERIEMLAPPAEPPTTSAAERATPTTA